jgi:hypothetical protein
MPLRDHFQPPLDDKRSRDELHGGWPAMIVLRLSGILPDGYAAAPSVRLGGAFEVSAYEPDATARWAPPAPTLTLETDLPEQDEYEVRVYDARRGRRLVAAIEIVSPSNKDRPASRRAFVAKITALLQQDVCVSIVDVVTSRQFNLYADLLALIGRTDPALGSDPPHLYAVTLRGRKRARGRPLLDTWFYRMTPGQALPQLPIWLDVDLGVTLDLDGSYEDTCRVLRMA